MTNGQRAAFTLLEVHQLTLDAVHALKVLSRLKRKLSNWFEVDPSLTGRAGHLPFLKPTKRFRELLATIETLRRDDDVVRTRHKKTPSR